MTDKKSELLGKINHINPVDRVDTGIFEASILASISRNTILDQVRAILSCCPTPP